MFECYKYNFSLKKFGSQTVLHIYSSNERNLAKFVRGQELCVVALQHPPQRRHHRHHQLHLHEAEAVTNTRESVDPHTSSYLKRPCCSQCHGYQEVPGANVSSLMARR